MEEINRFVILAQSVRAAVSSSPKTAGLKITSSFRKKRRCFWRPPA